MKWLGLLFMIAGAVLITTLYLGNKKQSQDQQELVRSFRQMATERVSEAQSQSEPAELKSDAVGILTVPKLDMELPVVEGAGPEQLAKALGAISGLDEPGQMDGSYAIAGHRSSVFGKFFNRLDELKQGDSVELQTMGQQMMFKVYDKRIVKPEEIEVLKPEQGKAKLSLVTCHPANSSKYRLIVLAEQVK